MGALELDTGIPDRDPAYACGARPRETPGLGIPRGALYVGIRKKTLSGKTRRRNYGKVIVRVVLSGIKEPARETGVAEEKFVADMTPDAGQEQRTMKQEDFTYCNT